MAKRSKKDPFNRSYRQTLGDRFSEGARLLWLKMQAKGWSQADVRAKLAALTPKTSLLSRWLYGDQRPGVEWAFLLQRATGIEASLWSKDATDTFVPPAARVQPESLRATGTEG